MSATDGVGELLLHSSTEQTAEKMPPVVGSGDEELNSPSLSLSSLDEEEPLTSEVSEPGDEDNEVEGTNLPVGEGGDPAEHLRRINKSISSSSRKFDLASSQKT